MYDVVFDHHEPSCVLLLPCITAIPYLLLPCPHSSCVCACLLSQDHARLGKQGDIIQVKAGHARNQLHPQGTAEYLTYGKMAERKLKVRGSELLLRLDRLVLLLNNVCSLQHIARFVVMDVWIHLKLLWGPCLNKTGVINATNWRESTAD